MLISVSLLANDTTGLAWKWIPMKPKGSRPSPRSGVSITTTANGNSTYAFGGVIDAEEDEEVLEGHFSNDLLMLDLVNHKWWPVNLKTKSDNKSEQLQKEDQQNTAGAEATSSDGVFTMTVGGSGKQPEAKSVKADEAVSVVGPSPRMKSGLAISKGVLYLYGGQIEQKNKQFTLNDLHSLGKRSSKGSQWKNKYQHLVDYCILSDIHKLDEWKTIIKQADDAHEWLGDSDSESDDDSMSDDSDDDDSDDDSDMDTD